MFKKQKIEVGVKRLYDSSEIPTYATEHSACFDLRANFDGTGVIKTYSDANRESRIITSVPVNVSDKDNLDARQLVLFPGMRAMIPTGLIFDIPVGWSLRIYARSGLSLKNGISLANSEGVIDSDYTQELFILLRNNSNANVQISHGDRIAQGEFVPVSHGTMFEVTDEIQQKTSRSGGMGSTGVK